MKLCIFDLDGTLIDSLGDLADSTNFALRQNGLPQHPETAYRYFVGNGAVKLVTRAMPEEKREDKALFQKVFDDYSVRYEAHCFDRTHPYPGILPLLSSLRKSGVTVAVLSNKPDPAVRQIAARLFPDDTFDLIFGQRPEVLKKPAPDGVFEVMRLLGAEKEETLFIGDSDVDILTAKNANVSSLGVCWGFRGREELVSAGADLLADDSVEAEAQIRAFFDL